MPKHPIAKYLLASYCYYELDNPIMTDEEFDKLCKYILTNYDTLTHMHKHLVSIDNLKASSALGIEYPLVIQILANDYQT